jgi:hypothetical protein
MSGYQRDVAAASLHEARLRREQIAPLPQGVAPRTEAEGADVQRALAHLAGAASPGGFKIGATAKRMQEYLGLTGPAAGFMATGDVHPSGITVRLADFVRPGVECELAVRLAHDLPPGPCTAETAAAAVGELVAGIEIVDKRYGELRLYPLLTADYATGWGKGGVTSKQHDWSFAGHRKRVARPARGGRKPTRRRRRRRPDGPPDELPGLAGRLRGGRGVRRASGRPGRHARQLTPPVWLTAPPASWWISPAADGAAATGVIALFS